MTIEPHHSWSPQSSALGHGMRYTGPQCIQASEALTPHRPRVVQHHLHCDAEISMLFLKKLKVRTNSEIWMNKSNSQRSRRHRITTWESSSESEVHTSVDEIACLKTRSRCLLNGIGTNNEMIETSTSSSTSSSLSSSSFLSSILSSTAAAAFWARLLSSKYLSW